MRCVLILLALTALTSAFAQEGSVDPAFVPQLPAATPVTSVLFDATGRLLIGTYVKAGGTGDAVVSALRDDGSIDPGFRVTLTPDADGGGALRMVLAPNGDVFVAGRFNHANGQPARGVIRVHPDGSLDSTFAPGFDANAVVFALGLSVDGKLYVGGSFTTLGGAPRVAIARLTLGGALDDTFNAGPDPLPNWHGLAGVFSPVVYDLLPDATGVSIAGAVLTTDLSQEDQGVFIHFEQDGTWLGVREGVERDVTYGFNAIADLPTGREHIALAGDAFSGRDITTTDIFRSWPSTLEDLQEGIVTAGGAANPGSVQCLLVYADGRMLAGGDFNSIAYDATRTGTAPKVRDHRGGLLRLGSDFYLDRAYTADGGADSGSVNCLAFAPDGKVIVGGEFSKFGGVDRANLARLQGAAEVPRIVQQPADSSVTDGAAFTLTAHVVGTPPLQYQWELNGTPLPGETRPVLSRVRASAAMAGSYQLRITNQGGTSMTNAVAVTVTGTVPAAGTLVNFSARGLTGGTDTLIAGFSVTGGGDTLSVLLRGVGPGLKPFGVAAPVAQPELQLFQDQTIEATNDGWDVANGAQIAAAASSVGAFALPPGSTDTALLQTLAMGTRTVQVVSHAATAAVGLAEVYALPTAGHAHLSNASTRAWVGSDGDVLIAGFTIASAPKKVLLRAIGPTLANYGVGDALHDPRLRVYAGQTLVGENDDWNASPDASAIAAAATASGAFALDPASRDAAWVGTLQPGSYTAVVSGSDNGTGTALIEIYDLDP